MNQRTITGAAFGALALLTPTTQAQTITMVVIEGQTIGGVGNVTFINNLDVNDNGDWIVELDTDAATTMDVVVVDANGVLFQEDQLLTVPGFPTAALSSFDSVRLNNLGNTCWNHFLRNTATGFDSGIFWNSTLVILESDDSAPISGLPAPNPWTGFFESFINDQNQLLVMGSVNEPTLGTSTTDRFLVRLTLDGTGAITSSVVVGKEDDMLPGMGATGRLDDFDSGSNAYGFNNNGDAMFVADIDTPVNGDKIIYTWIGGVYTPIAEEGTPAFFDMARDWDFLDRAVDLNDSGEYVYTGSLAGDTLNDDVIVKNGTLFVREGDSFPAIAPFALSGTNAVGGSSSNVSIDNSGNVVWHGTWNDPDLTRETGIFQNLNLLVQEGVTVLEAGLVARTLSPGQDKLAVSDNGRYILFEAELTDLREGVFLIDMLGLGNLGAFCFGDGGDQMGCTNCPCGNNAMVGAGGGCLNSNSSSAVLTASGTPDVTTPADSLHFDLTGGNVNTFGVLVSGDNQLPAMGACPPGSGIVQGTLDGLRCVGGNVLRHGSRALDGTGATTAGWGPPANPVAGIGVTAGFVASQTRYFQCFYREVGTLGCLTGQNTSNAIAVTFQ